MTCWSNVTWNVLGTYPLVSSGYVKIAIENGIFSWENQLFLWPCSIAMLNYQRVVLVCFGWSNQCRSPVFRRILDILDGGLGHRMRLPRSGMTPATCRAHSGALSSAPSPGTVMSCPPDKRLQKWARCGCVPCPERECCPSSCFDTRPDWRAPVARCPHQWRDRRDDGFNGLNSWTNLPSGYLKNCHGKTPCY